MTATPTIVDRGTWQEQIAALRLRENAHTREGDAIAAARRRLPMVEVDPSTPVVGPRRRGPLIDTFEGGSSSSRRTSCGTTASPPPISAKAARRTTGTCWSCPSCTLATSRSRFLRGTVPESDRYREFLGWEMPGYWVPQTSLDALISGRHFGMKACYLRDGDQVFETDWTTGRGFEMMGNTYGMLDQTVYGRQEPSGGLSGGLAAAVPRHAQRADANR